MSFRFTKHARRVYGELAESAPERVREMKSRVTWVVIKKLALAFAIFWGLAFIFGTAAVVWISRDLPSPDGINERVVAQSTKIYDRTGEHLLYEVGKDQKRTKVELSQIAPLAVKATIAIEDKHFYEHSGIRVISIIRAGFYNLIGRKAGSGGASTLTQQFIKKTMVGDERTIFRKIKEAILALRLEKKYSKDDILKMYLNEIPYGSTNYGIEAASQSYFHKKALDLTIEEGATLAAMIQAPSRYLNDPDSLRDRRDAVLRLMYEQGYINEDQKNTAQNAALHIFRNNSIMDAPHFVMHVKQLLDDQFGEKTVDTSGLKVITTLDYDKQILAQNTVKEMSEKFAKESNANNAAMTAIDPKTGQILAMVGSRDYNNEEIDGQFNIVTLGKLQPGSSFKPFVYTYAFEKGYTPDTVLYDVLTNFDMRAGGDYSPKNYDNKDHGLVTIRKALQGSLNIPAVKMLYLVGIKDTMEFAKRFGYTTFTGDYGLSLVLGGAEVNLLEHTNAYATLADNGVYHAPVAILKVTDSSGNTLSEWKEAPGTEAIKPELAALTTSVLTDDDARAFTFGHGSTLTLPGRPVAAKTGTTNNYYDAWTLGYTPSLAAGVWVGNTPKHNITMKGGGNMLAGKIWNKFMVEALKDTPVEQFPAPPPNDAEKPVLRGSNDGIKLKINRLSGKIASSSTPDALVIEKTFLPPHDILFYVNKDDPRGPAPADPTVDPQYENWEAALQQWVEREKAKGNEISFEEPPTEYDPIQSPELVPTLEIITPAPSSTFTSRDLNFEARATAPRGIARVTFQIDGLVIGTPSAPPFTVSYNARTMAKGIHTLKVIAEDDLGNWAGQEVNFDLEADFEPPSVSWDGSAVISRSAADFPSVFYLSPYRWDDVKDVKIYLTNLSGGSERLIYTFNHTDDKLFGSKLMFTWNHAPDLGTYTLRASMTDKTGRKEDKTIQVEIN